MTEAKGMPVQLSAGAGLEAPLPFPMALLDPFRARAMKNHCGQTLERLAERGGLSPSEILAIVEDRAWHHVSDADALAALSGYIRRARRPADWIVMRLAPDPRAENEACEEAARDIGDFFVSKGAPEVARSICAEIADQVARRRRGDPFGLAPDAARENEACTAIARALGATFTQAAAHPVAARMCAEVAGRISLRRLLTPLEERAGAPADGAASAGGEA